MDDNKKNTLILVACVLGLMFGSVSCASLVSDRHGKSFDDTIDKAPPNRPISIAPPPGLTAEGYDCRNDLIWDRVSDCDEDTYNVYRAQNSHGPWKKLNTIPHTIHVYSDFIGENNRTYYYRVTRVVFDQSFEETRRDLRRGLTPDVPVMESPPSEVVSATPLQMNDNEWLDSVQKAFFRYFWDFGHPVSGLSRMAFLHHPRHTTTTGGTGFGMVTIMVGAERGFVSRAQAAKRLLKMTTFFQDVAPRYHGVWAHRMRGDNGVTIPFSAKDNGGDIVETAFLIQCMIIVREYFDRNDPVESELRARITRLWKEVEWDWYLRSPGNKKLYWHWSPEFGWEMNHQIDGWNECQIVYLLAIASPTHPIPADCYYLGWASDVDNYVNGSQHYGITLPLGRDEDLGGALFWTHYSYIGMDPSKLTDAYTNYFEHNRAQSLINRAYCVDNPRSHKGYGPLIWGITSSQTPGGYRPHRPGSNRDNGTIAPTAAISSLPYTPRESMATLKHFYYELGPRIWGPFGFHDAFNMGEDWVSDCFLAIDQGPMTPMIENHRTGLPWELFMRSDVAKSILERLDEARPAAKRHRQKNLEKKGTIAEGS